MPLDSKGFVARDSHFQKALFSIALTDAGMTILFLLLSANAKGPISRFSF
jgi:hypothetical protein